MSKTRAQKEETIKQLDEAFNNNKGVVFASYVGLTVHQAQDFRKKLRDQNACMITAKKTLLKIAFGKKNLQFDEKAFCGSIAMIAGDDEVLPAKTTYEFIKKHKNAVKFVGGILEGDFIDAKKVQELAQLPSKEELYARVVGSIGAPLSSLVRVLQGNLRGLVQVLKGLSEQKS